MLIVFDTCTREEYRRDVHRLLALPIGSVLRYEYKRHLFSPEAAAKLSQATVADMPIDVLLMYGELNRYRRGDSDKNLPMLDWQNAKFVPTRSAKIVNVSVHRSANVNDDVIHFHLELRGFIDPESVLIERLVKALESANQLPFGTPQQQCWISSLPTGVGNIETALRSDADTNWSKVVDWMFLKDTQFKGDIFWRVLDVVEAQGAQPEKVILQDRPTNRYGSELWHRDYEIHDHSRYEIRYETHDPTAHGEMMPGGAKLALVPNDSEEVIRIPVEPAQLRQNQIGSTVFSVKAIPFLGSRFAGIEMETQVGGTPADERPRSDPGSRCHLTFRLTKNPLRVGISGLSAIAGTGCAAAAAILKDKCPYVSIALGIAAVILGFIAYYAWTGRAKT